MATLSGMKEICNYVRRSEATVLDWIKNMDFPAKKLSGIWESDRELIDDWRRNQINGGEKTALPGKKNKPGSPVR